MFIYEKNGNIEVNEKIYFYNTELKANHTVYSDRMWQWDCEKYNETHKKIWGNHGQYFNIFDCEKIEKFLSLYFEENIKLVKVQEYTNASNGYPFWRFDFFTEK